MKAADRYGLDMIGITDKIDWGQIRPMAGALTMGKVSPSSDLTRVGFGMAPMQGARSVRDRPSQMGCAWPNSASIRT
jgi:hypothetical protein